LLSTTKISNPTHHPTQHHTIQPHTNHPPIIRHTRLHTIIDADRVMVLDQGNLVEFDSPSKLMSKEGGIFRGLVEESRRSGGAADDA